MGSSADDSERLLEEGRAALRAHRYDAAYDALRSAQGVAALDVEDLHRLAEAAWWLGLMSECLQLTESAHRDFLASGHLDRAAAQALDLGGMLAMRGEPALASGWLGRARRLLADQPVGPIHGVLWYVDLSMALEEAQLDEAEQLATELRRLGDEYGDESLVALGYLGSGLATLRRGRVRDAFVLLEEAVLRVVGGGVSADWAGHIYCTMVSACLRVADLNRARQWSEAAHRWLEDFSEAVMFTGVCRAHDVELLVLEGAWVVAGQQADVVVSELRELNVEAVAEAEYQHGECHRLRGDFELAERCFERAASLGRDPQPGRALLLLARGEGDGAWSEVTDAVVRGSADPFRCARLLRAQVEIGVATGRSAAAAAAARRLRTLADDFGTPGFQAWADHAAGLVALAAGRPGEAIEPLGRAAEGYRRMRAWYDAASADARRAEAHGLLGDPAAEREHRDAAESAFRRLGIQAKATAGRGSPGRRAHGTGGGGLASGSGWAEQPRRRPCAVHQ